MRKVFCLVLVACLLVNALAMESDLEKPKKKDGKKKGTFKPHMYHKVSRRLLPPCPRCS
jgi:hypothetical protein